MSKLCVISCPISTFSGYGARSRDLVKALIKQYPDWDVKILAQRWGDTRQGFLEDNEEQDLLDRVIPNLTVQPDVWIQITVPNEFQPVGKYNVGITAGIETTIADVSWVQGCNRMDLVLVSSKHSKETLLGSRYINQKTKEEIKIEKPVEVLFEGIDTSIYTKDVVATEESKILETLKNIETSWNFLCVGHWLQGDFGQDRKNMGYTIKMFLETFKDWNGEAPGLILKVSGGIASIPDRYNLLKKIDEIRQSVEYTVSLPKIYLLHGDLTDSEMNILYNDPKVKCMVSFTKGEGYGRPLAEFAAIGKPILCSGWSGHLDFLEQQYTALVGGKLEKVHPSAVVKSVILPDAKWFTPDDRSVQVGFTSLFVSYKDWEIKAKKQAKNLIKSKDLGAMQRLLKKLFVKYQVED